MLSPVYCAVLVHIKQPQTVKISGALLNGVSHNHIVVLGRETPEINQINYHEMCGLKTAGILQQKNGHQRRRNAVKHSWSGIWGM